MIKIVLNTKITQFFIKFIWYQERIINLKKMKILKLTILDKPTKSIFDTARALDHRWTLKKTLDENSQFGHLKEATAPRDSSLPNVSETPLFKYRVSNTSTVTNSTVSTFKLTTIVPVRYEVFWWRKKCIVEV